MLISITERAGCKVFPHHWLAHQLIDGDREAPRPFTQHPQQHE
jgi:hypothetical protein